MTLRVGVVGLGLGRIHAQAYDQTDAVDTVVLCDPDLERAQEVQSSLGKAGKIYPDLEAMLDAEALDAVSIVTPDHLHRPHVERALAAGCHILLTKPLAAHLDDACAIVRASQASDRKVMIAHEARFRSREQRIKAILDQGELGDLIHLRIDSFHYKYKQFQQSPWYAAVETGRTAMTGTGIHEVDLVRYLTGQRIESVFAYGNRLGTLDFHDNKTVAALFQLEGGTIAQVTVTYVARPDIQPESFSLLGTKGMIAGDRVKREGSDSPEDLPKDEAPIVTGTRGCVARFVQAIAEDSPVAVDASDAFASLAACAAADQSCQSGMPVVPVTCEPH